MWLDRGEREGIIFYIIPSTFFLSLFRSPHSAEPLPFQLVVSVRCVRSRNVCGGGVFFYIAVGQMNMDGWMGGRGYKKS
jgi:hypothetical protein